MLPLLAFFTMICQDGIDEIDSDVHYTVIVLSDGSEIMIEHDDNYTIEHYGNHDDWDY